ncbi:MAG: tRNA (adenosine(37)-N6)-threonylcarbamoyltransferase complex ATPase subunit type 1 TsaE [Candidatus Staskawiczbacteria bacterium RIFCSPLOWO2_01_FULL_38_12b]|uniref:tRNA threonylcarbamoyladenosine biosynthesis protein TsaE n=1 Tax=Candidatus Staskawiczbacteria bacterium RIFCSPLOWO2_01_FULL_38_12b TaxID=1802214 RepID=A0A1G2IGP9_9BACT|nr:MAG: tRNA (adenosine(37)-N6)-threonylcarbamoyltransferase complex ATPase subunit type 1 TsaE [Candidatus Staskawiczbacteria bacterium RIFCSPLOWO2_01_FULL_38_12b]
MEKIITHNFKQTQKIGQNFAHEILTAKPGQSTVILALQGDLGAGKTTFLQGFAKGLGIKEVVNSPTFVIMKRFKITPRSSLRAKRSNLMFKNFYHFDLYRLNNPQEILDLGFGEIIKNPENIVAIEWPEKIKEILPKDAILITFDHLEPISAKGDGEAKENKREIKIDTF